MSGTQIALAIVTAVGSAAIGALATIWTGAYGYWNTDRSQDIQMVNIALSILSGENKETSLPGRKFALRALDKYAEVDIPQAEFEEWAAVGTLPENLYQAKAAGITDVWYADNTPYKFRANNDFERLLNELQKRSTTDGENKPANKE